MSSSPFQADGAPVLGGAVQPPGGIHSIDPLLQSTPTGSRDVYKSEAALTLTSSLLPDFVTKTRALAQQLEAELAEKEAELAEAERLGAIPLPLSSDPVAKIRSVTDVRGADVVIEVVGHADAFMMCFDMVRPWGTIHSIGVHSEMLPLNGQLCYGKNVTMAFGRCPVRSIFDEALAVFQKVYPKLEFLCSHVVPLEEAPQAYRDFEARKAHKIVFRHGRVSS